MHNALFEYVDENKSTFGKENDILNLMNYVYSIEALA